MRRCLSLLGLATLSACGLVAPLCQGGGPDGRTLALIPATYALTSVEATGDTEALLEALGIPSAEGVTVTLAAGGDEVVVRYRVNGQLIVDRWSVVRGA